MRVYTAPEVEPYTETAIGVFLAGSIEQGSAVDWQADVLAHLSQYDRLAVYNPRRANWDPTWEQSITNEQFVGQVEWELEHLDNATIVFMFLAPGTFSPITLLEFGMFVPQLGDRLVVVCPEGYWRKGNVDVTARYWGVPVFDIMQDGLAALDDRIKRYS